METSWEPAVVGFRQKDQIGGISSPKLSLLSLNDVLGAGNKTNLAFSPRRVSDGSLAATSLTDHRVCSLLFKDIFQSEN